MLLRAQVVALHRFVAFRHPASLKTGVAQAPISHQLRAIRCDREMGRMRE